MENNKCYKENKEKICKFCRIVNIKSIKSDIILYEDDLFVIFADIKPKAQVHLQAVPKLHIINIDFLSADDISLLEHMKESSVKYLLENYHDDYKKANEIK